MIKHSQKMIDDYVQKANLPPLLDRCPCCHSDNVSFKQHDNRKRKINFFTDELIIQIEIILLFRWKCYFCKDKFTVYPDFLLPYKRFITNDILKLCHDYIKRGTTSYRKIVQPHGSHYVYSSTDSCELSHVTVWNWFKTLASFMETAHKATLLLVKKIPNCGIHRDILPITARKFQSEQRHQLLKISECVMRTYDTIDKFNLNINIFPIIR